MKKKSYGILTKMPADEGDMLMRFIASDMTEDRDGDVIDQSGWQLDRFKENPVFLWAHDYSKAPIGACREVGLDGGKLMIGVEFDEEDDFAKLIKSKYERRILNAVSVGFQPLDAKPREDGKGYEFTSQSLLEVSAVPVPSNPAALAQRSAAEDVAVKKYWDLSAVEWLESRGYEVLKDVTDFPTEGDDKKVSLRNSSYGVFDPAYARAIKEDFPDIWEAGGNIEGNDQYRRLTPVVARGGAVETETEEEAVRKREAWAARHEKNFRLPGVVAQMKWYVVGSRGEGHMKEVMNEAKKAFEGMTKSDIDAVMSLMSVAKSIDLADAIAFVQHKAAPDELNVGDFVEWDSSGGMARGQIESVERDGEIDVPDANVVVSGTEDDPAALIRIYQEEDDGFEPTDVMVAHKFSTLTPIDPLPAPTEEEIEVEEDGNEEEKFIQVEDDTSHDEAREPVIYITDDTQE